MEISFNKCLLSIYPYRFTEKQINELREENRDTGHFLSTRFPKYCIDENNEGIKDCENYLQFVGYGDKEFICFDVDTADGLLKEEISNIGLFDGEYGLINPNDYSKIINIITNSFQIFDGDKYYSTSYNNAQYIVIQLAYIRTSWEYVEYDLNVEILGYLTKNLELIENDGEKETKG